MHNHSAFVSLLTVSLVINCSLSKSLPIIRKSDANANVFKLLLGLYKLNPLKGSPVFQAFSENLLMGMGRSSKDKLVLNFESGESIKVNEQVVKNNLNELENMIHKQKKKPFHFEEPEYDLDGVSTENFKADLVIDDTVLSKESIQNALLENHNIKEDFGALFEHMGSNEIDTHVTVTKLIPVVDTITRYSEVSNQNEAAFSQITDTKARSVNYIDTQGEFDATNPKEVSNQNEAVFRQITDTKARSVNYIGTQGEFDDTNPKEVSNQNETVLRQITDTKARSVNYIGTQGEFDDRNSKEVSNQNETVFRQITDTKARSVNYLGTQGEFDDRNPKQVPMNNLDMRDVITI